jgi:drug/metabolite transporter (DMT)-like permease
MTDPATPPQRAWAWSEYALLLLLATCWGATYPLTKIAIGTIPPITFLCWRSLIGGGVLLLLMLLRGKRLPRDGAAWRLLSTQQIINGVFPFLLITWAQQYVPAALTVVLASTTPIFAFLITWGITRHEPATGLKLIGVVLGLAGTLLIIGLEALSGLGEQIVAQMAIAVATISFAFGTIYGRRLRDYDPMVTASGALLFGGLLLLPFSLALEAPWTIAPSREALIATVVLALTGSALGLMIFYRLINTIGSIATNAQAYLRIPIGVALSVFLVGESVPPSLMAGLALVFAGVLAMTLPQHLRA